MEDYKHLYEQTKLTLEKYQGEIVPGLREQLWQVRKDRDQWRRVAEESRDFIQPQLCDELEQVKRERDAVTKHMIELEQELARVKAERDELADRNRNAYEIAWGRDIPSPTVPEYVELHDGMTRIMKSLRGGQKEEL